MRRWSWAFASWLIGTVASADTFEITEGMDLRSVLSDLSAGDEVVIHEGRYVTGGRWGFAWNGTEEMPIVVRGADGEARPVIEGNRSQNVMDLDGSYFELRGLEIVGGSHGVRLGVVDHAVLEDLRIHDVADVGISCNRGGGGSDCAALVIRRNEIFDTGVGGDTGEGMYLGCNGDDCRIYDSVIELNYVHDTRAGSQGDGIELKYGSYGNLVRDNVIVRTKYPGILVSSFPAMAGRRPNVIERNLVWDADDNGIQLGGQAIVRNNIVLGAGNSGIQAQPSRNAAGEAVRTVDAVVLHNTVVNGSGTCFRGNEWITGLRNVLANNAFYCAEGTAIRWGGGEPEAAQAVLVGNIVLGGGGGRGARAGVGVAEDLGDPSGGRVYPPAGSALVDAADPAHAAADDFNGDPRDDGAPDVGAYERSAARNPGWPLGEGFKDAPSDPSPADAGTPSSDAGGSDGGAAGPDVGVRDAAGAPMDAGGADAGRGEAGGGCACSAVAPADGVAPLLLLAFFAGRRRHGR